MERTFYLGTHMVDWVYRPGPPLFLSHRRLSRPGRLRWAARPWCLDSGGFSELSMYGKWQTGEAEYVDAVERYRTTMGGLIWAAPQDWMCEPWIVARTRLSVIDHQWRTIESYLRLKGRGPFIPVLQGWSIDDYTAHVAMYDDSGVDLTRAAVVGLGSVCRRQATDEIGAIARELAGYGIRLHGLGVKTLGLVRYGEHLVSADSMAWSQAARRESPMVGHTHKNCANCEPWANRWRSNLLDKLDTTWHQSG